MTVREIAGQYRVGAIPRTAYVWRPGMKDWVFLPEARPLKEGLSRLGLDLDETMMSMAKLSNVAAASGPSSAPPPPRDEPADKPAEAPQAASPRDPEPSNPSLSRAQATFTAPVGSSPKPADLAPDGPSIVVEDVEGEAPKPGAAKMETAPVTVRRAPAISSKPTVRMKRPKLPPIKKKARFPIGTVVLVLVISAAAGLTGYWLSQRLGAEQRGEAQPERPRAQAALRVASAVSAASAAVGSAAAPGEPERAPRAAAGFDRARAEQIMEDAANRAAEGCRLVGAPTGRTVVLLSFLPSGESAGVLLDGVLAGTSTGRCVLRSFHDARVPPFTGEPVAMKHDVVVL